MVEVDPFRDEDFYHIEKIKCMSLARRLVRQVDMYAIPITLRYKSEKMFYTNFGAFASILLVLGMVGLATSELIKMFTIEELTLNTSTIPIGNKDKDLDN